MRNEFAVNYDRYVLGNMKSEKTGIFINCSGVPYIDLMFWKHKKYETRDSNSLDQFVGKTVYLIQTGKGDPIVRGTAEIGEGVEIYFTLDWEKLRKDTCVPKESRFDKKRRKSKWLYPIINPTEIRPFRLPECERHGRVYATMNISRRDIEKLQEEYAKEISGKA